MRRSGSIRLRQERLLRPHMIDGREHGFCMCSDSAGRLVRGHESVGDRYSVNVDINCPSGSKPIGIYHTHPGGTTQPSKVDISEAQRYRLQHLCISVPETGETECHNVPPKRS